MVTPTIHKKDFKMLVITRTPYDSNTIILETSDGQIEVCVFGVNGNQVKIGVKAPDIVDIWRAEVLERAGN